MHDGPEPLLPRGPDLQDGGHLFLDQGAVPLRPEGEHRRERPEGEEQQGQEQADQASGHVPAAHGADPGGEAEDGQETEGGGQNEQRIHGKRKVPPDGFRGHPPAGRFPGSSAAAPPHHTPMTRSEEPAPGDGREDPGGGGDAGPGPGESVPAGELERVIRRAAEIQFSEGEGGADALSSEEVVRIGREVGLAPEHVRRALAEVRAESLLPEPPEDDVPLKVLGGGTVRASRAVPGDRREVQAKVEEHFRTRESLQSVRRRPGRSLWEPSEGVLDKMQRAMDVSGRGYELAEARRVELSVSQLEPGWSLAAITVDARNLRVQHAVGWAAGAAPFCLAAGLALDLAVGVPWLVSGPLVGGGALASGAAGGGWSYGRKRRRLALVLDGLLDRLEQGASLEPERRSLRERILGDDA